MYICQCKQHYITLIQASSGMKSKPSEAITCLLSTLRHRYIHRSVREYYHFILFFDDKDCTMRQVKLRDEWVSFERERLVVA